MDSDEEIEEFYKNWLLINKPQTIMAENTEEEPPVVNNISNIIFQNDNFEL